MEWQPIDTAPKDGTEVLVTGYLYRQESNGRWYSVGTARIYGVVDDDGDVMDYATHWMPLAPPP